MEVSFKNKSDPRTPVVLMRGRKVVSSLAEYNLNSKYLSIKAVGEGNEGVYTLTNPKSPADVKRISLVVRGTG